MNHYKIKFQKIKVRKKIDTTKYFSIFILNIKAFIFLIKRREYENDSKYNSGFGVNEYLLKRSPDEELRNKIIKVKEEFLEIYL